jgi:predicted SprT family Zn-dependent metalloprotease
MTQQEAEALALPLMQQWGLTKFGWSLSFSKARFALGQCHFAKKQIRLSIYLLALNEQEKVKDIILHEIAHALAGPEAGHGPLWRAWARKVGAQPERRINANIPPGDWSSTCRACGLTHTMYRKPKRQYYCQCRKSGVLEWTNTPTAQAS